MKKKLLILNTGIVLAILFALVYVLLNGSRYTMRPSTYITNSEITSAVMECDTDGIVELERAYLDDEALTFEFKALGKGRTTAVITYQVEHKGSTDTPPSTNRFTADLEVNSLGVIVDRSLGINFTGYRVAIFAVLFILLLTESLTLWIFADGMRKGQFNYSMVSFGGIGIFALAVLVFTIYKMNNNVVNTFAAFLSAIDTAGSLLFMALVPVMLVMGFLLALSNIWLMRHEGYRPANALGIIFGAMLLTGTVMILGAETGLFFYSLPLNVIRGAEFLVSYFECMFLATVISAFLATRYKVPFDKDYIIILGCGIFSDGSLTPLLIGRVDRALRFEKEQFQNTGKHAVFVPSGGQGPDEIISEGQAMTNYLLEQGIPEQRILCEGKSCSTYENMSFSRKIIEQDCGSINEKKVAFSTTNYHVFRGYILAKKCGFYAQGLSARTKAYFYPNAFLREFAGLLVDQAIRHLINITVLIALFILITIV